MLGQGEKAGPEKDPVLGRAWKDMLGWTGPGSRSLYNSLRASWVIRWAWELMEKRILKTHHLWVLHQECWFQELPTPPSAQRLTGCF